MNLIEIIEDERGVEMLAHFNKVSDNRILSCYNNLVEYINKVGLNTAYEQFKKSLVKRTNEVYCYEGGICNDF